MRGYPQFSFWISIKLVTIYIFRIIINRGKNTFELVGTVLKHTMRICIEGPEQLSDYVLESVVDHYKSVKKRKLAL